MKMVRNASVSRGVWRRRFSNKPTTDLTLRVSTEAGIEYEPLISFHHMDPYPTLLHDYS
jgi:hypothetical protein